MSVITPTTALATATPTYPDGLPDCPGAAAVLSPLAAVSTITPSWIGHLAHEARTLPLSVDIGALVGAAVLIGIIAYHMRPHTRPQPRKLKPTPPKTTKPTPPKPATTGRDARGKFLKKGDRK